MQRISKQTLMAELMRKGVPRLEWGQVNLQNTVGIGAFAVVHKAVYHKSPMESHVVAVKTISGDRAALAQLTLDQRSYEDEDYLRQDRVFTYFLRECSIGWRISRAAALDARVTPLLGFIDEPGCPLPSLVFQCAEAGTIDVFLTQFKGGERHQLGLILMSDVARSLKHIHAREIVHRDLRPSNIVIDERSSLGRPVALLADFGSSKAFPDDAVDTTSARYTTQIDYCAPEYAMSRSNAYHQDKSGKADIWSLGCVMVKVLTSNPPWRTTDQGKILEYMRKDMQPPQPVGVSFAVYEFMKECWKINPIRRPTGEEAEESLIKIVTTHS